MEKLVCVIMGQNCEKYIGMCLESVKDADAIVFCDGGSTEECRDYIFRDLLAKKYPDVYENKFKWIENQYDQEDKKMNGKQRNFYLDYVKENYPDYWCLCLDADEIVEDLSLFKQHIQTAPGALYSPKMRHLIGDIGHEDSTTETHFVLNRFFKISTADKYPESEHPILMPKEPQEGKGISGLVIWHLAYISGMFDIKNKYENHIKKSEIHTKEFLRGWYFGHLFGTYPKKRFNVGELPDALLNGFGIPRDEMYFIGRGNMEVKHYQDAINWKNFFNPESCIIFGCGMGPRVKTLNEQGIITNGYELSKYAVQQKLHTQVYQADLTKDLEKGTADLTVAFDVLEHLRYEDLDKAIDNLIKHTNKHILISVPVLGNPALDIDVTHIIKESEEWWLKNFTDKGLKLIKTPDNFLYKEQVYIFEK